MIDIVIDTNILSDVISGYYSDNVNTGGYYTVKNNLTSTIIAELNRIVQDYREQGFSTRGMVVSSSFGFIELSRKFEIISNGRFSLEQFRAFITSPPDWFVIESLDNNLFYHLSILPRSVFTPSGDEKPVEWADALHVATSFARGESSSFVTTDQRLKLLDALTNRILA